jgi:putative endonuclease
VSADWYLYVAECVDGTYYTGITTNLQRRIKEHNESSKGAKYTRSRRPVKLILSHTYKCRSSASKAEHQFKKLSRRQKEGLIEQAKAGRSGCSLFERRVSCD